MRIVAWNCAGALHRKLAHLLALAPDIAVVPEGCLPERLPILPPGTTSAWTGRLPHKGLLVLGFGDYRVEALDAWRQPLEWILPVRVTGAQEFTLVAVWSMNHRQSEVSPGPRPMQPLQALRELGPAVGEEIVVIGDFNNNVRWDKPRTRRFGSMIDGYREAGLRSLYHEKSGEAFGQESVPTHWWRDRKVDGPRYHIDYAFVPQHWLPVAEISVGTFEQSVTNGGSDHASLVVTLDQRSDIDRRRTEGMP